MRPPALNHRGLAAPLAVLLLAIALAAAPARAGIIVTGGEVLTSGGVSADGPATYGILGGGGSAADPYKLTGGGTFVSDGNSGSITFRATGTIQFIPGEEWHVAWDFSTDLPSGSATWHFSGQADCPIFGTLHLDTPDLPVPSGQQDCSGEFGITNPFFWTSRQPFVADLVVDWTGAPGDTFTVTIPDRSIDLSMGVPEPASLAILSLAGLAALRRRRRAKR